MMEWVPIGPRVDRALADEESREFLTTHYLERLLDVGGTLEEKFSALMYRTLLLCGLFVLLAQAAIEKVSLSGLEIGDLGPIQKVLPAVIALSFLQLVSVRILASATMATAQEIVRNRYPAAYDADLEVLLGGPDPKNVVTLISTWHGSAGMGRLIEGLGSLRIGLGGLFPLLFEFYAFGKCFDVFGFSDPLTWFSLVISAMLFIEATVMLIGSDRVLTRTL